MVEQAGRESGQGAVPRPGLPDGALPASYLPGFGRDGAWDACPPSASLTAALEAASGPGWRCPGASRDEMFGLLRQWQALEAWAAAGKLAVLRALIREDDQPLPGGAYQGDLPEGWSKSLTHEVAAALAMPVVSADRLMWLAWDLEARLPGIGGLLASGELTYGKAKGVTEALQQLTDEDAAAAEALILPDLPGKTYGQAVRLAARAALTVDPDSAARRREDAEQNKSRVQLFREESGAAGLSGRDMPTDQALAAHASVCARAQDYKDSGAFGDGARMDQLRVAAYLELLNGIPAEARIASGLLPGDCSSGKLAAGGQATDEQAADGPSAGEPTADKAAFREYRCSCRECDGSCCAPPDDDERGDDPDGGVPAEGGPHGGPGGGAGPQPDDSPGPGAGYGAGNNGGSPGCQPGRRPGSQPTPASPPRLADLVLPLATLLGLAERPGEGHGLGTLDPGLCRQLAATAVGSAWTRLCVTVTDPDGITIGHGCARPARHEASPAPPHNGAAALPARVNLTITAARLAEPAAGTSPPGRTAWAFTQEADPGPPGGYGTWTLALPDGRNLTVNLGPVPTFGCDHRYQSHAYQPNDTLRHLVQIRDGECTFPPCSRSARESDFEHAAPCNQGGRTCACNAGARSRACHRVKQSPGWTVTRPQPGWHEWTTPSGRTYIQGPKRYPA